MTVLVVPICTNCKTQIATSFLQSRADSLRAREGEREGERERESREANLGQFGPHTLRVQNQKSWPHTHSWANPFPVVRGTLPWEHPLGTSHLGTPIGNVTMGTSTGIPIQYIHWEHPREHPFSTSIENCIELMSPIEPLNYPLQHN